MFANDPYYTQGRGRSVLPASTSVLLGKREHIWESRGCGTISIAMTDDKTTIGQAAGDPSGETAPNVRAEKRRYLTIAGRKMRIPGNRTGRLALGGGLVAGGTLGFLPALGFWMIPLGLLVLSVDLPVVRRVRRRADVWVSRRLGRDTRTQQREGQG